MLAFEVVPVDESLARAGGSFGRSTMRATGLD